MQIAVTSQNRKTITEHAGKCRKFWIYKVEQGEVAGKHLVEIPMEQSLHASDHLLAEALAEVNVLITASMGADLHHRLKESGILPIVTMERDPDTAIAAFLTNSLAQLPVAADHQCHDH